jgi:hypothetical protein
MSQQLESQVHDRAKPDPLLLAKQPVSASWQAETGAGEHHPGRMVQKCHNDLKPTVFRGIYLSGNPAGEA